MYHQPALLHESIEGLGICPDGVYADLTFGGGGHSREILKHLGKKGRLFAFDQDEDALQNTLADSRFTLLHQNFRFLKNFMRFHDALPLDGILADLGISSHQIDTPERGFATRFEGPLDMRMAQNITITAADIVNTYAEENLRSVLELYGEIDNVRQAVYQLVKARKEPITTTQQLCEALKTCAPRNQENKYMAQVFQALRIEVNDEMGALKTMLKQSTDILRPGGRLVIISYHSLEDRLVKNFIKTGNFEGRVEKDFYGNVIAPFQQISRKPITPSEKELIDNPRSRSAKLRVAERMAV